MLAAGRTNESRNAELTLQRWLAEARRTGEKDAYAGKRNHPRFTWQVRVTVHVIKDGQPGEAFYANARDISAGGMGLRCRRPIPERAVVRITVDGSEESILACVRHCTEEICAYLVGVEFRRSSPGPAGRPAARCPTGATAAHGRVSPSARLNPQWRSRAA